MTISKRILSDARVGYLYSNGKLVLVHESKHSKAGKVEWVTIHDTEIKTDFDGRIVLHYPGVNRLTAQSVKVKARSADTKNGSENSRKAGIAVGYFQFFLADDYRAYVQINDMPGLIGFDLSYQPEYVWTEPKYDTWSDYRIAA